MMGVGTIRFKDQAEYDAFARARHVKVSGEAMPKPKQKAAKLPRAPSEIEEMMYFQIDLSDLPRPTRQYRPLPDRNYKLDFAWPDRKIALEVDGAVHRIKGTFARSFEREYFLKMAGWTVLHVGGAEVRSGAALDWITNILERR